MCWTESIKNYWLLKVTPANYILHVKISKEIVEYVKSVYQKGTNFFKPHCKILNFFHTNVLALTFPLSEHPFKGTMQERINFYTKMTEVLLH
jgi:hypothetical protein